MLQASDIDPKTFAIVSCGKMSSLSDNRKWTQDEIINNTRNVVRGLETLRNEHSGLLNNLSDFDVDNYGQKNGRSDSMAGVKANLVQESLEKIELGLGEAQASSPLN